VHSGPLAGALPVSGTCCRRRGPLGIAPCIGRAGSCPDWCGSRTARYMAFSAGTADLGLLSGQALRLPTHVIALDCAIPGRPNGVEQSTTGMPARGRRATPIHYGGIVSTRRLPSTCALMASGSLVSARLSGFGLYPAAAIRSLGELAARFRAARPSLPCRRRSEVSVVAVGDHRAKVSGHARHRSVSSRTIRRVAELVQAASSNKGPPAQELSSYMSTLSRRDSPQCRRRQATSSSSDTVSDRPTKNEARSRSATASGGARPALRNARPDPADLAAQDHRGQRSRAITRSHVRHDWHLSATCRPTCAQARGDCHAFDIASASSTCGPLPPVHPFAMNARPSPYGATVHFAPPLVRTPPIVRTLAGSPNRCAVSHLPALVAHVATGRVRRR